MVQDHYSSHYTDFVGKGLYYCTILSPIFTNCYARIQVLMKFHLCPPTNLYIAYIKEYLKNGIETTILCESCNTVKLLRERKAYTQGTFVHTLS